MMNPDSCSFGSSFTTFIAVFFIAIGVAPVGILENSPRNPFPLVREPENSMRLSSQVALVTGAASGISRAVAVRFAREGAAVMAADASEGVAETVEIIKKAGGNARFAKLDVSDPDDVGRVLQRILDEFGDLHILFNGAGILSYGTVLETTQEAWNRMMAVNLTGTFLCASAVLAHMVVKGRGSIINVASTTVSHDACAHAAAYVT